MRNLILAALLAATAAASANAASLVNPGFENGTTGWTSSGTTGTTSALDSFMPMYGNAFGVVTSASQNVYSTLTQSVSLAAGQTVKGGVGFKTTDYQPYNDDGYLSVNGVNLFTSSVAAVGDYGNSGWNGFSFTAPTAGSYTFQVGVRNIVDSTTNSYVVLDVAGVPEPATWSLLIGGFGMTGLAMRRRRVALAA